MILFKHARRISHLLSFLFMRDKKNNLRYNGSAKRQTSFTMNLRLELLSPTLRENSFDLYDGILLARAHKI